MATSGSLNCREYAYDPSLNVEKVKEILEEIFPERSVYFRTTLFGKFACVNINKFNCIFCKVKAYDDNTKIMLALENENTVLGNIFLGGLVGYFLSRSKGKELMEIILREMDRRYGK